MRINSLWRLLTRTALDQSSGKLETAFFESVYRINYASGLSLFEKGTFYLVYGIIIKLSILLFISSELWFLFSMSSSLDVVIDNINVTTIHLIVLYRYKSMTDNKEIFRKLATSMHTAPHFDIKTPERKKLLEFWAKMNEIYFKRLLVLASCTLTLWYTHPLWDDVEYNMVAAVRLPFEYQTPDRYAITYVLVLIVFHYTSAFVVVNDLMMLAHLLNLLCQFNILADCFENILLEVRQDFKGLDDQALFSNDTFRQKYLERLGNLVEQHKFILNNTSELKTILSAPMLGQLIGSTMLICLAGYQVTAALTNSYAILLMMILYLAYNMYILYIMCRWCDDIKTKSEYIGEAVYCSGWELGLTTVPGVRLRLMLVMARASRPLILTAGGLYDLSLGSYANLVKTSYSALTILLRSQNRAQ